MDLTKVAAGAVASAAASAPKHTSSEYEVVAGPFEVAGGVADAYLTKSPAGVTYCEHRPKGQGRVKRVPLATVAAVFPQIAGVDAEPPAAKPKK